MVFFTWRSNCGKQQETESWRGLTTDILRQSEISASNITGTTLSQPGTIRSSTTGIRRREKLFSLSSWRPILSVCSFTLELTIRIRSWLGQVIRRSGNTTWELEGEPRCTRSIQVLWTQSHSMRVETSLFLRLTTKRYLCN